MTDFGWLVDELEKRFGVRPEIDEVVFALVIEIATIQTVN